MKRGKRGPYGPRKLKGMRPSGGEGGRSAPRQNGAVRVIRLRSDGKRYNRPQTYEIKRRAVQLYLEEGIPGDLVAREVGISLGTVFEWVKQYREHGEEGLRPLGYGHRSINRPNAIKASTPRALIRAEITALKRKHPSFGIKRISQTLRRLFHLPASPETVRKTLHREKLIKFPKKKTPSNPSKPRFFERSTPNQLWQSDIFPFKLGGEAVRPPEWLGPGGYVYLIGFIDDHSRYITALEAFRSQTADNLLEVFRRGVGAHGLPKEMLTDNGRQYASWAGKTKFQQELERNRIQHIRSSPHHPQTLGKIERFWKTIWEEFLSRARFATFEEVRERLRWWVQY